MFKIIEDNVRAIRAKLVERSIKIESLEDKNKLLAEANKSLQEENRVLKQKLAVSESRINNLQLSQNKIRAVINRLQSYVGRQEKLSKLEQVLVSGLSESNNLTDQDITAINGDEKRLVDSISIGEM